MLAVVKAHQSRAKMQDEVSQRGIQNCPPMAGLSSFSPGSFVITMTPICDRSLPQKPVESVSVVGDMNCVRLTSKVGTQNSLERVFRIKPVLWGVQLKQQL